MRRSPWKVRRIVRRGTRFLKEQFEWQTSYYGRRRRLRALLRLVAFGVATIAFGVVLGIFFRNSGM